MTDMDKWSRKEEWWRRGAGFLIVVKRHEEPKSACDFDEGPHRWSIYAYIYPSHALFNTFDGNDMWQPAALCLPLHCGPSFLRWHYGEDGNPTTIQVGADYRHLHDARFTQYATPEQAREVFEDADRLFDHLSSANLENRQ